MLSATPSLGADYIHDTDGQEERVPGVFLLARVGRSDASVLPFKLI